MEPQNKPIRNKKKRSGWYILSFWILVGGLAALSIHPLHRAFNPLYADQGATVVSDNTTQPTAGETTSTTVSSTTATNQRSKTSTTLPASDTATRSEDAAVPGDVATGLSRTLRTAANAVLPSVVSIQHTITPSQVSAIPGQGGQMQDVPWQGPMADPLFRQFFEGIQPMQRVPERSLGSGVVIDASGIILTNNHVVEGGGTITVRLHDGREFSASKVMTDPKTDLAVVRIENAKNLTPANLGDSDRLQLGDWVIAVGDPFGLNETVTAGIISAKGRGLGITDREEFLQTDAAINPGNSGGPLVNLSGEVVGINTAISSTTGGYQGIGFAIPINLAKWVSHQLVTEGRVHRAYLGVGIQKLTPDLATQFGISGKKGVLVTKVFPDTPGSQAGLKSGDVITAYDDHPVESPRQLQARVEESSADSSHKLTLIRAGKETRLSVAVREQPTGYGQVASRATRNGNSQPTDVADLGIHVVPLTEETKQELGLHDVEGVVIASVDAGSLADDAGLTPAMVITRVGKLPVTNVDEFVAAMKKESLEQGVLLLVQKGDASMFVVIRKKQAKSQNESSRPGTVLPLAPPPSVPGGTRFLPECILKGVEVMLNTRNPREKAAVRPVPDLPLEAVGAFASNNGVERQVAREKLVAMGKAATPALVDCLEDPRKNVRWEAAKTLIKIRDPAAAEPLVAALEDEDGDVRWLAAVALAAIGREALRPLLVALIESPDSNQVLRGGHHVCHELARTDAYPIVKPVLDAIDVPEPRTAVPPAAYKALHTL